MSQRSRPTLVVGPVLGDLAHSLTLTVDAELLPVVRRWLPYGSHDLGVDDPSAGAWLLVEWGGIDGPAPPRGDPILRLGCVSAWPNSTGDEVSLHGPGRCRGSADLRNLSARITTPRIVDDLTCETAYAMLTMTAALLLARMGCALVHAGAVAPPEGGAWLVVGDARSGKSTTCMNLVTAGWQFLSDDQVVLVSNSDAVTVHGWPREIHVDNGWHIGTPIGTRGTIAVEAIASDRRRQSAPLEGILLPRVAPALPTEVTPVRGSDAFAQLVRQSPWLMADRSAAPLVLTLLTATASRPRFDLRLGLDSFRSPELARLLRAPLSDQLTHDTAGEPPRCR